MSDPNKLKQVKEIKRDEILFSIAQIEDTNRVMVGASDAKLYELDLEAEKPEPTAFEGGHTSYVTGLVLSNNTAVSGSWDGKLVWWDTEKRESIRTEQAHAKWIRRMAASPDGKLVASVADDMVCCLWETTSGKRVKQLRGHDETTPNHYPSMLYACAFSPDGKYLATGDRVGKAIVWEVDSGKQAATLEAPIMYTWDPKARRHSIGGIRSVGFSADSKLLAVGGMGKVGNIDHLGGKARLEVFDWQKGERTVEYDSDKYKGIIEAVVFDNQGQWLLAAGGDHNGFLLFYDLKKNESLREEKAGTHIHAIALDDKQERIFTAGHQRLMHWTM